MIWAAIEYTDSQGQRVGPVKCRLHVNDDGTWLMYYGFDGLSYQPVSPDNNIHIRHKFAQPPVQNDYDSIYDYYDANDTWYDNITNEFNALFPPKVDWKCVEQQGFISPDGLFYYCGFEGHSYLAKDLLLLYYGINQSINYEEAVLSRGWITVRVGTKITLQSNWKPTTLQQRTISKLMANCDTDARRDNMAKMLGYLNEFESYIYQGETQI